MEVRVGMKGASRKVDFDFAFQHKQVLISAHLQNHGNVLEYSPTGKDENFTLIHSSPMRD